MVIGVTSSETDPLVCYGSYTDEGHEPTEMVPTPLGNGDESYHCNECGALVKHSVDMGANQ